MTNSTTVSPVLINSAEEYEVRPSRAHCAKYGEIWTKKATKYPVCLAMAEYDQLWRNFPHYCKFRPTLKR